MVGMIYPAELLLNQANSSDTEAPFLDLYLSMSNGIVSSKIQDDFDLEIVNFQFLDENVPQSPSYGIAFGSVFVLLERVLMLMTSTTETYF